jgi:multidrug efflux pump subunit AcrA (membrane-fusion protein)
VTLCAAAAAGFSPSASAAGPPLPVVVTPDPVQARLQAQVAVQRAQAQARLAADQARVQAQLDANQARLQGRLAAQQAGTQAQLEGARQSMVTAAQLAALSLPMAAPMQGPLARPPGTMELTTLTPRLGHYFGADHGVLVVRAPTRGVLKLQDGDVILSIGGRVPATSSQAIRILTSYDPGEKITLVILREHHKIDITATMPGAPAVPGPPLGP